MTREERENALHCLKVMIDEEVCEECNLYGTTGTDHCEADCVRVAIEALKEQSCDDCCNGNQTEKAKLCQKSYIAGMEHTFEDCIRRAVIVHAKKGHWISLNTGKPSPLKDGMTTESVKCSECDEWLTASDEYSCSGRYCPNCGIKMER